MSQLPRVLAYLDDVLAASDDLGIGLAAIAAVGSEVALVARQPSGTTKELTQLSERCLANAKPAKAMVLTTGRADVAQAVGAYGVVSRSTDLAPSAMKAIAPGKMIFSSVHSLSEARTAVHNGADALVVGTIWTSPSHPDGTYAGLELISECAQLERPVFAIGGVTAERAKEAKLAGAWGVAAISAIWKERKMYQSALQLVEAMTS